MDLIHSAFFVSAHTHHGRRADALWSKARVIKSVSAEVNWNDGRTAVAQSTTQPVSFFVSVIQCSQMTFAHMSYGGILFAQLCDDSLNCHHHNVKALRAACHCLQIIPPAYVSATSTHPGEWLEIYHSQCILSCYSISARLIDYCIEWIKADCKQRTSFLCQDSVPPCFLPPPAYDLKLIPCTSSWVGEGGSGVFFTLHLRY